MKRILLILKLASTGVSTNKVRSLLTVLGIVIGIASVIAMLSLGTGAQADVIQGVSALGTDVITITPGGANTGGPPSGFQTFKGLSERDYDFVRNTERFPYIDQVSPVISTNATISHDSLELAASLSGVNDVYGSIQDVTVTSGRFFSEGDVSSHRNVIVVGTTIVRELFPRKTQESVIGESISILGVRYEVIGVLEEQDSGGFSDPNEQVYVPWTTMAERITQRDTFSFIQASVTDSQLIEATVTQILLKLADYRNVDPSDADFSIFTSDDILGTLTQITDIFTVLLASIAGISLVVGGIGISNIMLVSVTERTKEIGLRKAIGAKERDILLQFLFEAVFLTLLGGIIGIILGITAGQIVSNLTDISAIVSLQNVLLATLVSISVGIAFGFAPAYKAGKLDPIDALRYE